MTGVQTCALPICRHRRWLRSKHRDIFSWLLLLQADALLAKCIKKAELIAYEDLGAEALRKLYVEDMPLVVIIDSEGNNLYEEGRKEYLEAHKEN